VGKLVDLTWSTHVLMLPSDIVYGPELLQQLLAHDIDMVAPLVWRADVFYDTFAFVRAGQGISVVRGLGLLFASFLERALVLLAVRLFQE